MISQHWVSISVHLILYWTATMDIKLRAAFVGDKVERLVISLLLKSISFYFTFFKPLMSYSESHQHVKRPTSFVLDFKELIILKFSYSLPACSPPSFPRSRPQSSSMAVPRTDPSGPPRPVRALLLVDVHFQLHCFSPPAPLANTFLSSLLVHTKLIWTWPFPQGVVQDEVGRQLSTGRTQLPMSNITPAKIREGTSSRSLASRHLSKIPSSLLQTLPGVTSLPSLSCLP